MIDDEDGRIVDVASRQLPERAVEKLLCGTLHMGIERGADLRRDECAAREAQGVYDKMTRVERALRIVNLPRLDADLLALAGREVAALLHSVGQLIERSTRSRGVAPKVHPGG